MEHIIDIYFTGYFLNDDNLNKYLNTQRAPYTYTYV